VKLFVTADIETRAQRRFEELVGNGADTTLERVMADVEARDARDASRDDAPMKQAPDALLLDTTELSIDAAVAKAADYIEQALAQVTGKTT
jgi:cytidylate kinase